MNNFIMRIRMMKPYLAWMLTAALLTTVTEPGFCSFADMEEGTVMAASTRQEYASGSNGTAEQGVVFYESAASPWEEESYDEDDYRPEEKLLYDLAVDSSPSEDGAQEDGDGGREETATPSDVEKVMIATPSSAAAAVPAALYAAAQGTDLWENWSPKTDWTGDGTEDSPFRIENLSQLMGLSYEVAHGRDFKDEYFELTSNMDISIYESYWNPIGWYLSREDMESGIEHPFRGSFDGKNHIISGLRMVNTSSFLKNAGLFGIVEGGSIRNLTVMAPEISGDENTGILAGKITGGAVIYNVTVSGAVYSNGNAGGIAGYTDGDEEKITIENCRADNIAINISDEDGFAGGIAGVARKAYLVDNTVLTQDGSGNRIQGKGYVGGIAGCMEETDIYGSYVDGTIGGNAAKAVGGIAGKYVSGSLVLARMAGDIGRTNMGQAKREGIFVGTRDASDYFTYGTDHHDNFSYLFTTADNIGAAAVGSTIDGDNAYKQSAHIGYWLDNEKKYVIVEGERKIGCGDRYFYEELEDGVKYIVTQKLSLDLTADEYMDGLSFHVDHYAPGYMGEPVHGYLVYVPVISAQNVNGTIDADVAVLSAIPAVNSSYYRTIDKDHPAAVMPGASMMVLTAPKDTAEARYQMIPDQRESGGVVPPTYTDAAGNEHFMTYQSGGTYSFLMPNCDTELKVQYQKVTTKLDVNPAQIHIQITQTRSGDRKNPQTVTEVKNTQGILIARYINDEPDTTVEVQPIAVHAEHNETGGTVDRRVLWSVDDMDLILNQSESGYTEKDGRFLPNMNSAFIRGILQKKIGEQADGAYQNPIDDTVYTRDAVMTAMTNPDTSADHLSVYANCRITVSFRIVDETTLRVEGMSLNRSQLTFTVTRKRTGYRYKPTETITCSAPVVLSASLYPVQPFLKAVAWAAEENGKIVNLKPGSVYMQDCTVSVNYDPEGLSNPAWIQNIINEDNEKWETDKSRQIDGSGTSSEVIRAVSEDQTNGIVTAECAVTVNFITIDETVMYTSVSLGGGSGGGGGGGSSSSTVSAKSVAAGSSDALPDYVVKDGNWKQNDQGQWMYANDHTYTSEWAAIQNPYANPSSGQAAYEWFRFDANSVLVTGWYKDEDGNSYYLNPVSDGTLGGMITGWYWIDGRCYYFQEISNGTRGALLKNTITPDGYEVNERGEWIVDGTVQNKAV